VHPVDNNNNNTDVYSGLFVAAVGSASALAGALSVWMTGRQAVLKHLADPNDPNKKTTDHAELETEMRNFFNLHAPPANPAPADPTPAAASDSAGTAKAQAVFPRALAGIDMPYQE
jgi:hypothetical protein